MYNVKIVFWHRDPQSDDIEERGSLVRALVEPSIEPVFVGQPGGLREPSGEDAYGDAEYEETLDEFVVSLEFTDTANRRWRRDLDGSLHEVAIHEGSAPS